MLFLGIFTCFRPSVMKNQLLRGCCHFSDWLTAVENVLHVQTSAAVVGEKKLSYVGSTHTPPHIPQMLCWEVKATARLSLKSIRAATCQLLI